jgi:uncharacterized membrane protein
MEMSIEIQNMDSRLTDMEEKIDKIDKKLTQVVDAILGNPLTKQGGFVHDIEVINNRIQKLERSQAKLEDFKKRFYWTAGIAVGIILFFQYMTSIYKNIK